MNDSHIPSDIQHRRRFWAAHIKAFEQSGFSRREYCRRHDLPYHVMGYWLRRQKGEAPSSRLNLVQLPLIPACSSAQAPAPAIILRLGCYTLELHQDVSQSALARVLAVLESR